MIGFIVSPEISAAISAAVKLAMTSRNLPPYIGVRGMPVLSGEHAGLHFLPFEDAALDTPLHAGTRLADYPEFEILIGQLGGLDARVSISPEFIIPPNDP